MYAIRSYYAAVHRGFHTRRILELVDGGYQFAVTVVGFDIVDRSDGHVVDDEAGDIPCTDGG